MNFYKLLKLFSQIKSPRIKLGGLLAMHVLKKRYIGIFLDPVLACNLRCRMCYFSDAEKRKQMQGILAEEDVKLIAKALFHRALKLQIGCGAEPTLYKSLPSLVRLGKQYGIPYISITTNGNLLDFNAIRALAEAGVNEFTISAHGIRKETYESLMPGARYELFVRLLGDLKTIKQEFPDLKVRVNYTMNEDNVDELKDFWTLFGDFPLNILQLRPIQQIGESDYQNFSLTHVAECLKPIVFPLVEQCKQKNILCIAPQEVNIEALEKKTEDLNAVFESLTYCYISPKSCWQEDFDYHQDSFESYSRRTKRISFVLKKIFSLSSSPMHKKGKNTTRMMNYTVK